MPRTTSTSTPTRQRPRAVKQTRKEPIGRDAWLRAGRETLIEDGIRGVEIGRLARKLGATRGGFYWFFKSRQELLDLLLDDWRRTNSAAIKAVLDHASRDGATEFQALVSVWVNEAGYSPAWDAAVRDWGRRSTPVAKVVRRVDDDRIGVLRQVFKDLGFADEEAFVRARVTYFHQVGYYAMGVQESRRQRLQLLPLYTRVLTGR